MAKKNKTIEEECMRIALSQVGNLEGWIERTAKKNPEKALRMWEKVTEFAVSKKTKEASGDQRRFQQININMVPAKKSQEVIDISENAQMNTEIAPPSDENEE